MKTYNRMMVQSKGERLPHMENDEEFRMRIKSEEKYNEINKKMFYQMICLLGLEDAKLTFQMTVNRNNGHIPSDIQESFNRAKQEYLRIHTD